jgi:dTDP-4-dehydrorhamnose reductase
MKNILVTGAGGMLGEKIVDFFSKSIEYNIFASYRTNKPLNEFGATWLMVDLKNKTDFKDLLLVSRPDIIIHCAAFVNLDQCEIDDSESKYLHYQLVKEFANVCPNAYFIYISTDSVFDGETGNYSEYDIANPLNKYALTKCAGEKEVVNQFKQHLVIRTNIYGFHSNNGYSSLAEWAITKLSNNEVIGGFDDVIFNPVYTLQLAYVIDELVKLNYIGIVNVGCDEVISKFNFLKLLAKQFSFSEKLVLKTNSLNQKFTANRPLNTSLNTTLLKNKVNINLNLKHGVTMLFNDMTKHKKI